MGCGASQTSAVESLPPKINELRDIGLNLSLSSSSATVAAAEHSYHLDDPADVHAVLCLETKNDGPLKLGNKYCNVYIEETSVTVQVKYPLAGDYKLAVYATEQDFPDHILKKGYYYEVHIPVEKTKGAEDTSDGLKITTSYNDEQFKNLLSDEIQVMTKEQLKELKEQAKIDAEKPVYDNTPLTPEEIEQLRQDLLQGIENKDRELLINKTALVEAKNLTGFLQEEYTMAQKMLATLKLRYRILQMELRTMTEIRNYRTPPPIVHDVICAALLLLGHHEEKTLIWLNCKGLLESSSLRKRIDQFDVGTVHPEIMARSLQLVGKFTLAEVCLASAGAGAFYNWVQDIGASMSEVTNGSVKPANDERQKEIFHIRPPSPKWNSYL